MFRVLILGDVIGRPGRRMVQEHLPGLRREHGVDLVVANGENASAGFGINPKAFDELTKAGVDVLTSGNHIWDKQEVFPLLHNDKRLLRPHNYPPGAPGSGVHRGVTPSGAPFAIVNLMGRVFMPPVDCPFRNWQGLLPELKGVKIRLVDFHAEATSEKYAFAWMADGAASAVWGTHTHVPSADTTILPEGCAFQADVGMTGGMAGVIGMERADSIKRFLTGLPVKFTPAKERPVLNALLIGVDEVSGRAEEAKRLQVRGFEDAASWK